MPFTPQTRRLLGRVTLVAAALLVLVSLAGVVLWRRLTALPAWFEDEARLASTPADEDWIAADPTERAADPATDRAAEDLLERLDAPLDPGRHGAGGAAAEGSASSQARDGDGATAPRNSAAGSGGRPRAATIRNFHLRSAVRNESIRRATKASRAEFLDGELRAGVVLEPAFVERDTLDPATQRTLDRALRMFPGARSRRVYIGLVDTPRTVDGLLQLGPDTRLRVGDVELGFDTAMRRLGLSPARVRGQIDAELRRLNVRDPRVVRPVAED